MQDAVCDQWNGPLETRVHEVGLLNRNEWTQITKFRGGESRA